MKHTVNLRKLVDSDLRELMILADNRMISDDMLTLPVPFTEKDGLELVERSGNEEEVVRGVINVNGQLAGVVMLRAFEKCHRQAELSVWIGESYWGKGYGTEALNEMTRLGFENFNLNRIYACCMVRNIASQRILEKSGFLREGLLRERVIKKGIHEDVYIYAKLKKDK